jgi:hypothetical protein
MLDERAFDPINEYETLHDKHREPAGQQLRPSF